MDWPITRIKSLREILATIYPKEDDARQVVTDVGMKPSQIEFTNKAITTWYHTLERARLETGRLDRIYNYVLDENPDNEELKLVASATPPEMPKGPEVSDWRGPSTGPQLEKIIGQVSTLVPITYLELGLLRSRPVARVRLSDGSSGTGFLVANDLLITNNHVLPDRDVARSAAVQFNYQQTLAGLSAPMEEHHLLPDEMFKSSEVNEDDWTAVRVEGKPSEKWGYLELRPASLKRGDHVNIIQHAGGGPKQVSFNASVVVFIDDTRIQYLTDTLPGSSGSPVFDTNWNLVGLHRSGGWLEEPNSPKKTPYYRNEGIPIDRLIKGIG
jgi:hypothetical protein